MKLLKRKMSRQTNDSERTDAELSLSSLYFANAMLY